VVLQTSLLGRVQKGGDALPGVLAGDDVCCGGSSKIDRWAGPWATRRMEALHQEHVTSARVDNVSHVVDPAMRAHASHDLAGHELGGPLMVVVTREQKDRTR